MSANQSTFALEMMIMTLVMPKTNFLCDVGNEFLMIECHFTVADWVNRRVYCTDANGRNKESDLLPETLGVSAASTHPAKQYTGGASPGRTIMSSILFQVARLSTAGCGGMP